MFIFSFWRKSNNYTKEPDKFAGFFPTFERSLLKELNQGKNGKKIENWIKKLQNGKKLKS